MQRVRTAVGVDPEQELLLLVPDGAGPRGVFDVGEGPEVPAQGIAIHPGAREVHVGTRVVGQGELVAPASGQGSQPEDGVVPFRSAEVRRHGRKHRGREQASGHIRQQVDVGGRVASGRGAGSGSHGEQERSSALGFDIGHPHDRSVMPPRRRESRGPAGHSHGETRRLARPNHEVQQIRSALAVHAEQERVSALRRLPQAGSGGHAQQRSEPFSGRIAVDPTRGIGGTVLCTELQGGGIRGAGGQRAHPEDRVVLVGTPEELRHPGVPARCDRLLDRVERNVEVGGRRDRRPPGQKQGDDNGGKGRAEASFVFHAESPVARWGVGGFSDNGIPPRRRFQVPGHQVRAPRTAGLPHPSARPRSPRPCRPRTTAYRAGS